MSDNLTDALYRNETVSHRIKEQKEIIALDRQETQQQRPESPTVTPPGV